MMRTWMVTISVLVAMQPSVARAFPESLDRPEDPMTRAAAAVLIAQQFLDERYIQAFAPSRFFTDVPVGEWFSGAVNALHQSGAWGAIDMFRPNDAITSHELHSALFHAARLPHEPAGYSTQSLTRQEGLLALQEFLGCARNRTCKTYDEPFWNPAQYKDVFLKLEDALRGAFRIDDNT